MLRFQEAQGKWEMRRARAENRINRDERYADSPSGGEDARCDRAPVSWTECFVLLTLLFSLMEIKPAFSTFKNDYFKCTRDKA